MPSERERIPFVVIIIISFISVIIIVTVNSGHRNVLIPRLERRGKRFGKTIASTEKTPCSACVRCTCPGRLFDFFKRLTLLGYRSTRVFSRGEYRLLAAHR
jgi:prepilin signal peptidase PulO-like enzyme (type II secretory pathway)